MRRQGGGGVGEDASDDATVESSESSAAMAMAKDSFLLEVRITHN